MHSLELVLDDATDRAVRDQWRRLVDAGLPSQARHTGSSNRPHITLALAAELPVATVAAVRAAAVLPVPIRLGGLLVFTGRRAVVSRLVVASAALLELQAAVMAALGDDAVDPHGQFAAGAWTPHVTLARRLTADELGPVLEVAGDGTDDGTDDLTGRAVALRQWDMTARVEGVLVSTG